MTSWNHFDINLQWINDLTQNIKKRRYTFNTFASSGTSYWLCKRFVTFVYFSVNTEYKRRETVTGLPISGIHKDGGGARDSAFQSPTRVVVKISLLSECYNWKLFAVWTLVRSDLQIHRITDSVHAAVSVTIGCENVCVQSAVAPGCWPQSWLGTIGYT